MTRRKWLLLLIFGGGALVAMVAGLVQVVVTATTGDIFQDIEFSRAYTDKEGQLLQVFLTADHKYRIYRPLSDFPPEFLEALLLQEDRYFYNHHGVNPVALFRAFWETYVIKSRRMGASTITMQTARLKYGIYTKSVLGKLRQIFSALYLELCFSKQEILEAYVNLAPCGGNIEGFETASWFYFGKEVQELGLTESLMLCVLPQNPTKRAPSPTNTPRELLEARQRLFQAWVEQHPQDQDKAVYMDMRISTICQMPNQARHFTEMLNLQLSHQQPRQPIRTTLNSAIQQQCQELFQLYLSQQRSLGVNNGAFLLIDWKEMEVVANLGSANYYDDSIQGQVNATTSKRSPGSTLKPFIYALALEQGLIHYRTMLKDTPVTFNEYAPDNYGSVFKGPVQAWYALADSRNIPAIALNRDLQQRDLYDFLIQAGITGLEERDHYGLSLVLGTGDVTMMELATLYGILANNGIYKEINSIYTAKKSPGIPLLTEESAFIVKKMLEANVPPYQNRPQAVADIPIGYKTGTSIGFKDSWSVGIFDRYILCVWIGNFDGQGNNAFLGRRMAAPLLFNMAYSLLSDIPKNQQTSYERPENVKNIEVCSVSGSLPNPYCPQTEYAWFIPGTSPITTCKIHRQVYIDTRTGYRTDQRNKDYVATVVREFWPSDLQQLFTLAGLPRLVPPDYPPEEYHLDYQKQGYPPEIISPLTGSAYQFRSSDTSKNTILLCATADADTTEILWFSGVNFIGRSKPGESIEWKPQPGTYQLTATDTKGRSHTIPVTIQELLE